MIQVNRRIFHIAMLMMVLGIFEATANNTFIFFSLANILFIVSHFVRSGEDETTSTYRSR